MIIDAVKVIKTANLQKYCWSRIAQFQDVEYTTQHLMRLHGLPDKQRPNAKQQAEQLKYCLAQAKEYFEAAQAVSLATRPVLLYYCAMSLALVEILLKQSGESRLQKLRESHNCHGLQLVCNVQNAAWQPLDEVGKKLIVKAQIDSSGMPRGTFEVWRRSAREYPVGGYETTLFSEGATRTGFRKLLSAGDAPPPPLPLAGITLLDCLNQLPFMADALMRLGCSLSMVRATLSAERQGATGVPRFSVAVHPGEQLLIDRFGSLVKAPPAAVNTMDIRELPSGFVLSYPLDADIPCIYEWPHCTCMTDKLIFFSCSELNLGEFGFIYAALHICGNFARYYPDVWLNHIEKCSPLSMAIGELCENALDRLPLLSLSELVREYHVIES